ncbi:MAG: hypothetical protein Q8M26_08855 [Pseudolabrys sp.]|nr:hypothetical protein [Pseudolabrys sp.]
MTDIAIIISNTLYIIAGLLALACLYVACRYPVRRHITVEEYERRDTLVGDGAWHVPPKSARVRDMGRL